MSKHNAKCSIHDEKLVYHDAGYFCKSCYEKSKTDVKNAAQKQWKWFFDGLDELKNKAPNEKDKKIVEDKIKQLKTYFGV